MHKLFFIITFFISITLYSQSNISIQYNYTDYIAKEEYHVPDKFNVNIDLQNNFIEIWKKDSKKYVFKIEDISGPLYQKFGDKDDLLKYYQFETTLEGKNISLRYFPKKQIGLILFLNGEIYMRHYNNKNNANN